MHSEDYHIPFLSHAGFYCVALVVRCSELDMQYYIMDGQLTISGTRSRSNCDAARECTMLNYAYLCPALTNEQLLLRPLPLHL